MRQARGEVICPGEVQVVHAVQRCVRRAYLCGQDPLTGKSFEHRRAWIRDRLEFLASVFWHRLFDLYGDAQSLALRPAQSAGCSGVLERRRSGSPLAATLSQTERQARTPHCTGGF